MQFILSKTEMSSILLEDVKTAALLPRYRPLKSAWWGHGPFAIWLVKTAKPRVIVELGSHYGYSYFAMCQAVQQSGLKTRCIAVDTWQGDQHAGFYGDKVYQSVAAHNARYAQFSTLLRKRFDEALADVPDGSVDLLHVDGRHFYEDVKEDFESWIPKLSARAVVLFHDTEVEENNFGVKQYWQELRARYDGFSFEHSHGLGVLFFGTESNAAVDLMREHLATPAGLAEVRQVFSSLGAGITRPSRLQRGQIRIVQACRALALKILPQA